MSETTPTGLMAFWADIEPSYEPRFLEWHNCEHIPERLGVPGFAEGRRYRGLDGAPAYLMLYLTDTAAVLQSPAYLARLNEPTPWTRESLPYFRNPSRNIYGLVAQDGACDLHTAPYLITVRFNIARAQAAAVTGAIRDRLLPAWTALPAVGRVRFYAIDAAISGLETAERGIYGGGPGQQAYLLFVESAAPDADVGADWQAAWTALAAADAIAHVQPDRFRIDYALARKPL